MKAGFLLLLLSMISAGAYSQSTMRPNIYFQDMNYYNSAASALSDSMNVHFSLYAKHKFVENEDYIWNKPPIFFLNYIRNLKNKRGFYTVGLITDQYSFYSRNTIYGGYTHKFSFGKKKNSKLDIGARLVINFDVINWDRFKLPVDESGISLKPNADLDFGILYRLKGFTWGLSAKNLVGSSVKMDDQILLENQREYYVNTSYLFRIKNKVEIAPYVLFRQEHNPEMDLGLHAGFFKRIDFSYQLRLLKVRHVFTVQGYLTRSLMIGAAFDYSPVLSDKNIDFCVRYRW